MTSIKLFNLGLVALAATTIGCERQVSFSADIQPILAKSCISCHDGQGEGEIVSGLSLKSYEDLMRGTQYGQVVVPEHPMQSALYLTVSGKTAPEIQMPPHHEEKWAEGEGVPLMGKQIETIRLWIEQGAKNN